jgi:hypothetical protein
MTYKIVPTEQKHVEELSHTMRAADVRECWAANHFSPYDALKHSLCHTENPRTGLYNNNVMCIWGIGKVTYLSKEGIPWMLTSKLVEHHYREFLRQGPTLLKEIKKEAVVLVNMVDARNKRSIRWLKWLGFTIHDPVPFGPDDVLFHPFIMENYDV